MNLSQRDPNAPVYIAVQEPAQTALNGSGEITLQYDSVVKFSTGGDGTRRRAAVITNHDASAALIVKDSAGRIMGQVFPKTQYIIESPDDFIIHNTSAYGAIKFSVCEYLLEFSRPSAPKIVRGTMTIA